MRRLAIALITWCGSACDGSYAAFLNAVPVEDRVAETHVILAIDGLSLAMFDAARAAGAFAGWQHSELVTVFPGSSDYAWTRTLHTTPLESYEIEYFDRTRNTLVNEGLAGVAQHPIEQGLFNVAPCYQRFDFLGDGTTWMLESYLEVEAALPVTLDAMFDTIQARGKQKTTVLAYLINIDVLGHRYSVDRAVEALVEVERRIREFEARHAPGRYRFTILGDHGNTHRKTTLVDLDSVMPALGVAKVDALGDGSQLEAVPILNARVSYLPIHTHPSQVAEVSLRLSRHPWIDLVVAPLGPDGDGRRYGVWRAGARLEFVRRADASIEVADGAAWRALGVDLGGDGALRLDDAQAFDLTRGGPWPDLFARIHDAFTSPSVRNFADLMVSFTDDYAAIGFRIAGGADDDFEAGFHGSLSRGATLSVVATQTDRALPPAVRSGELVRLFPDLVEK